jgi:predicted metal-binding membrane protein
LATFRKERNLILALLVLLSVAAWGVVLWQVGGMASGLGMGPTMGLAAPLFLALWVAMMVAMMFPSAAPMILVFERVYTEKRAAGQAFVPTWVFVAGYLAVWTAFGALAFALAAGAEALAGQVSGLMENAARVGGGLLVLAGLYQLTPLKDVCLAKCRSPLGFILTSWREGRLGAFRMGLEHGLYCTGCCWLLFVILFPLGMANIAAMAALTLLIFAEKVLPVGRGVARAAAVALIAYGALVLFLPQLLPTAAPAEMPMSQVPRARSGHPMLVPQADRALSATDSCGASRRQGKRCPAG